MDHISDLRILLEQHLPADGLLPVFFVGRQGIRYIGHAGSYSHADVVLMSKGLKAAYVSLAQLSMTRDDRQFYIAHGE